MKELSDIQAEFLMLKIARSQIHTAAFGIRQTVPAKA